MGASFIYINSLTIINIKGNSRLSSMLLFVGGVYIGATYKQWWPTVSELLYIVGTKIESYLDNLNNVPKNATSKSTTSKISNEDKRGQSRVDASPTSTTSTIKKESSEEPLVEVNDSQVEDILKDAPVSSTESSSSQVIQDSEQNNKPSMQQSDALNNKKIWKQLSLPCCFKGLSREEASKAIDELYRALSGKYISCSSRNYFYYVFGGISLPNEYCPPSDSFISCNKGEAFLRTLIKILYNEKNGRVPRGTWIIAENIFLVNGEKIHTRLGQNTNKASVHYQREVNSIVKGVLNKVKSR